MDSTSINRLQQKLLRERDQLSHFLHRLTDASRDPDSDGPQDVGDLCLSTLTKESLFQQRSQFQGRLRLIERALHRIDEGTFGECGTCGDDINARRLEAIPWASNCLHCQEALEAERLQEHSPRALPFPAPGRLSA
jgi:DnaK suppressor protein